VGNNFFLKTQLKRIKENISATQFFPKKGDFHDKKKEVKRNFKMYCRGQP